MYRELRIAILILLISFIYGLTSFFSSGGFATPFFLSKFILVAASFLFLILNIRERGQVYLVFAFLGMISFAIGDQVRINVITRGVQREPLYELLNNHELIIGSFIVFFAFYYVALIPLFKVLKHKWILIILFLLLSGAIGVIIIQEYVLFQVLFSLFLGAYFVIVFRKSLPEKSVLNVLSALFILQLFLELFKYI